MTSYFSLDFLRHDHFPANPSIPFGDHLEKLFFSPRGDNRDFPIHGPNVIRFSTVLLDDPRLLHPAPGFLQGNAEEIDRSRQVLLKDRAKLIEIMGADHRPKGDCAREFLRCCALYHDIGKVIRRANHPQIGANLLRNSDEGKSRDLINAFTSTQDDQSFEHAQNRFARLVSVVQHHDKFGVVSTGEGGLPIFGDILYFRSDKGQMAGIQKNITTVMLLNLADTAAVNKAGEETVKRSLEIIQEIQKARQEELTEAESQAIKELQALCLQPKNCRGLTSQNVADIFGDWKILIEEVGPTGVDGDRGQLKRRLMEIEQNPARAILRILRLLRASSESSDATLLVPHFSSTMVESILVGTLGGHQMQSFCDQLASVVKLDYGLRFFQAVICGCVRKKLGFPIDDLKHLGRLTRDEMDALKAAGDEQLQEIALLATVRVIQVIEGLLGRYVGVLGSLAGRRFGIQMMTLSSDATILKTIIDFLCFKEKEFIAVTWVADEVTIWSMD